MAPSVRPNVLRMKAYSPGKPVSETKRELGLGSVIQLASNENPLGPSPKAVEAVRRAAADLNQYPDAAAYDLRQALSEFHRVSPENILLGNGSDEIISHIGLALLGSPDDEVLFARPSFPRYEAIANLADCRAIGLPLDSELRYDLPAMARACTPRTKLLFIANPNNPTGTYVTRASLDSLLAEIPDQALVVIDEAYHEFAADAPDYPSARDDVLAGRSVVGLRTFSKAYGLAGIRLGYGFGPTWLVDAVDRIRGPFNVNLLAQAAGVAALGDQEHVRRTLDNNRRGLARMTQALEAEGFAVVPSVANFVFFDVRREAQPVFEALL
ncbi:MAG: histidinol-phosphate transaminase, partial [Fimbriimonas ginsengisoli]|nr:histidinol-phosphate transaminase [Fimbriimonas ginsengisoli]